MHIWLVESSMVIIFAKSQFSLQQKNIILFNYHGSWNIIEKVPPTQSQLKVIINPTILNLSDEIHMIIQVLDTQDVHNRGQG